jgi:hypothetical protein
LILVRTLSKQRRLALLVLGDRVRHVLLALLAEGALLLGKVDLQSKDVNGNMHAIQEEVSAKTDYDATNRAQRIATTAGEHGEQQLAKTRKRARKQPERGADEDAHDTGSNTMTREGAHHGDTVLGMSWCS